MKDINKLAEDLVALDVTELRELAKVLKEKYGLEATAVIVPEKEKEIEAAVVEKTEFNVLLKKIGGGADKLSAVKLINEITKLGLKGSMDLTKSLPAVLKEKISLTEAEEIRGSLAVVNAEVEIN